MANETSTATHRNDTHTSTTDPQARLYRKGKGKEARLAPWHSQASAAVQ